jgi:hypothetical protein
VRFEGQDHEWVDVNDDRADRRLDVEHVDVGQCMWVVVSLTLFPCRIVKTEQRRRLQSEPFRKSVHTMPPGRRPGDDDRRGSTSAVFHYNQD